MTGNRSILVAVIVVAVSAGLALYFYSLEQEYQREMNQPESEVPAFEAEVDEAEVVTESVQLTLLKAEQTAGNPSLEEVSFEIPVLTDPAEKCREIVTLVLRNSEEILPATARVLEVYFDAEGYLILDLSPEVSEQLVGGIGTEMGLLESITSSLRTNVPEFKQVRFLVGGAERSTLSGHVSIRRPFR